MYIKALSGYGATCPAQIQGSNDGSTWENIGDSFTHSATIDTTFELDCDKSYKYIRVLFTLQQNESWVTVATMQVYGYEE